MRRKYPFTPILGWSISRYDKFESCKRQYWYEYYAKKWDKEIPPPKLDSLKSLTSTPLEIGNLVHDAIATQLHRIRKNMPPKDSSEVLNYSHYLADRAIREKTFLEVYYRQQERIDGDDLKARVGMCLENFFKSPWYEWLLQDTAHRKAEWVIEPSDFGEVRINGLKAYCKVDFLIPTDGNLFILDWKTGRTDREKHRRQMMGYVLYAQDIFRTPAQRVNPVVVYLGDEYGEMKNRFAQGELDDFVREVSAQTQEMYEYCTDINENIPRPKDAFPKNVRKLCAYCNYRELCGPEAMGR
ncbi:MAG: PD-(D/E)XK nuclease family protein [Chloroflexi bacterium]|nr:PD-(D/E)XK nuclease family protein [Chloroflexota bacterium]